MKKYFLITFLTTLFFIACKSTPQINSDINIQTEAPEQTSTESKKTDDSKPRDHITLLFTGDIMAHSVNYQISSYSKIYKDIKFYLDQADLTFANLEAPVDTTKPASSYPNFNMTEKYLQAAVDAGFDVFSLCNNHTNDQFQSGILETIKTTKKIIDKTENQGEKVYFSGIKESPEAAFTYNIIENHGWKILFLPVTELLNRPDASAYINFIKTDDKSRNNFIQYIKELKEKNPCDLFVLSLHTSEPEYTRNITSRQNQFYMDLISTGVDVVWANHAHIIKNRKVIVNTKEKRDKLIMYANGNVISGQRTKPDFNSKNPDGERDNTGDGLFYKVIFKKDTKGSVKIEKAEPIFITTYINTANEYVLKPLNQDFVDYLYEVPRLNWAKYIERRIKINQDATKDLIEWQ